MRVVFSRTHLANTINVEVTNTSSKPATFIYWDTPLDSLVKSFLDIRDIDNNSIEYIGPQAKRLYTKRHSLRTLMPEQTFSADLNIAWYYNVDAGQSYSISLKTDIFILSSTVNTGVITALTVTQTPLDLEIVSDKTRPPWMDDFDLSDEVKSIDSPTQHSEWLPYFAEEFDDETPMPPCPPSHLCYGQTYDDGGICYRNRYFNAPRIKNVSDIGRAMVQEDYYHLKKKGFGKRLSPQNNPLYLKWFGTRSSKRIEIFVKNMGSSISRGGCKNYIMIAVTCKEPDTIAYFIKVPGQFNISGMGLCRPYFRLNRGGWDSRSGTIAHELTHGFGTAVDHGYGRSFCLQLAKSNPDKAVQNADNYQYFIEEFFQL